MKGNLDLPNEHENRTRQLGLVIFGVGLPFTVAVGGDATCGASDECGGQTQMSYQIRASAQICVEQSARP